MINNNKSNKTNYNHMVLVLVQEQKQEVYNMFLMFP